MYLKSLHQNMKKPIKVLLALSGGVDSTASLIKLIKQGYDVTTLTFYFNEVNYKAEKISKNLGVNNIQINLKAEFDNLIINDFLESQKLGNLPNPCVICNKKIKYGLLFDYMKNNGYDFLSLGHYAKVIKNEISNEFELHKSNAIKKDQSYYLYHLDQEKLSSILFPLSDVCDKNEAIDLVKSIDENYVQKDSTGICFIDTTYNLYLKKHIPNLFLSGEIWDIYGNYLGKHKGTGLYVIGQKYQNNFVIRKNIDKNFLFIGNENDLYYKNVVLSDFSFINNYPMNEGIYTVKLSQWGLEYSSIIRIKDSQISLYCEDGFRGPIINQHAVIYEKTRVVGGGMILDFF